MAGSIREVRVRLSVAGGPQFRQEFDGAAKSMGALSKQQGGVQSAGNSVAGFVKKAALIAGVGGAVTSTVKTFGDFQQSLKQLQTVGGATAGQMQQVQARARELGKEVAGMSSTDAVDAMLELAKGGLSVDEAMQAATGTLNLAAAAQVSAAQAAEIQSSALNTFGLSADKAGQVADILANTANAASGEITDFAQGIAQAGTPAAQLGINLQDTSTALGLFANSGIKGSDAGTSLKTMLISLLNPTEKSQAALDELGVTAFDAEGNFVGLQAVSGQLAAAQKNMSVEAFNAAAATAFGSDAVRAAAVFAKNGAVGFDELAAKVTEAGGAQKVAAANTQGLKGALDRVKAAGEDAQIQIGEKLAPQIEGLTNKISTLIPSLVDQLAPALVGIGDAAIAGTDVLANALSTAGTVLTPLIEAVAFLTEKFAGLPPGIQGGLLALGLLVAFRSRVRTLSTTIATGFASATSSVGLFSRQVAFLQGQRGLSALAATGAVAISRLKGAARGLSAAFGGPIGLILVGLTTAMAVFAGTNDDAAAATEANAQANADLATTLNQVSGAYSDASVAKLTEQLLESQGAFQAVNTSAGEAAAAIIKGGPAIEVFRASMAKLINPGVGYNFETWAKTSGISVQEIFTAAVAGGSQLDQMATRLQKSLGDGFAPGVISGILKSTGESAAAATPGLKAFNDAVGSANTTADQTAEHFAELIKGAAGLKDIDAQPIIDALVAGAASGRTVDETLKSLNLTTDQYNTLTEVLGDKAGAAATALQAQGEGADGAAPKVQTFADAIAAAKAPQDELQASIEFVNAAMERQLGLMDEVAAKQGDAAAAIRNAARATLETKAARDQEADATAKVADAEKNLADVRKDRNKIGNAEKELTTLRNSGKASADEIAEAESDLKKAREEGNSTAADVAEAQRKVNDAKRAESEVLLQNKDDLQKDTEAREEAKRATLDATNSTILSALGHKSLTAALADGTAAQKKAYQAAYDAAKAMNYSDGEAKKYAQGLAGIPGDVSTQFKAFTEEAASKGKVLVRTYDEATGTWTASFKTAGEIAAQQAAGDVIQALNPVKGTWSANIDAKTAEFYSKLAAIRNEPPTTYYVNVQGRYVGTTGAPANYNTPVAAAAWTGGRISDLMGYAAGGTPHSGMLPGRPPTDPREDNLLAQLQDGSLIKVRSREFVVNEKSTADNYAALRYINGGGKIRGFATGGLPAGYSLAGRDDPSYSGAEAAVRSAIAELAAWVDDWAARAKDSAETAASAAEAWKTARTEVNSARHDRDAATSQARADIAEAERERVRAVQVRRAAQAAYTKADRAADKKRTKETVAAAQDAAKELSKAREDENEQIRKVAASQRAFNRVRAEEATKVNTAVDEAKKAKAEATTAAANAARDKTRAAAAAAEEKRHAAQQRQQVLLAQQLDRATASLAAAQEKVKDLRAQMTGFIDAGKSEALDIGPGLLGDSSFTGGKVAAGDLIRSQGKSLGMVRDYRKDVSKVASLGLNAGLLEQLKGDERGRMILDGLSGASANEINTLNRQYASLIAEGGQVGALRGNVAVGKQLASAVRGVTSAQTAVGLSQQQLDGLARGMLDAYVAAGNATTTVLSIPGTSFNQVVDSRIQKNNSAKSAKVGNRKR